MWEEGSGTRQAMERFFTDQHIEIRFGIQMTRNEAIKQGVRAGMGLGVLSAHTIELELETRRLTLLDVQDFPNRRHWYMVYWRSKRLSPAALAFHEFVPAEAQHVRETPI